MKLLVEQKQTGFTIVELLIVIVIIAILAAVSIVAYNGIQNRANDTVVEADLSAIVKKMELARVDLGHYPQSYAQFPELKLTKASYETTNNNIYYCLDTANDKYALGVRSKSHRGYIVNTGSISGGVSVWAEDTCDAIGKDWVNDATTWVMQGYVVSSSSWNSNWSWTN